MLGMSVSTPARWSRGGAHRHPSCFIARDSVFGWCVHAVVVSRSVCPRRAVLFTCDSFDSDHTCFFSSGVCVFRCGQAARVRPSVACAAHNHLHAMPAAEGQGNGCGVTPLRAGARAQALAGLGESPKAWTFPRRTLSRPTGIRCTPRHLPRHASAHGHVLRAWEGAAKAAPPQQNGRRLRRGGALATVRQLGGRPHAHAASGRAAGRPGGGSARCCLVEPSFPVASARQRPRERPTRSPR